MRVLLSQSRYPWHWPFAPSLAALALAGCTVGPDYVKPTPAAPADWSTWRSGDSSLRPIVSDAALPADWWRAFNDPVLDELETRAIATNPDFQTAALHVAQARVQRGGVASQGMPQVNANAQVSRQRQSEYGAATRLFETLADSGTGLDRDQLARLLAEPFTLYQGGLDAAWEIDLWGRVRRSIEAADAGIAEQQALLAQVRLTLASEIVRTYLELRATQAKIALARQDVAAVGERAEIVAARTRGGLNSGLDLERQRSELQAVEAPLPTLLSLEAALVNQLALLLGDLPGALADLLKPVESPPPAGLPDLVLGLPSEVALRRPDIRAAEARLHAATANIGVATADLYPSIRLGGAFNLESYKSENLFDWASRTWAIGPIFNLPLFDGGRRRRVVELRELQQREAAVAFQKTVLQAWQEIDDSLNGYGAEQQQNRVLTARVASTGEALGLAQARYDGGQTTYLDVIDARRGWLQAKRDLADSNARLGTRYAAINKAVGNTGTSLPADQP